MAAALNLAGIDHYQLSVIGSEAKVPTQEWLVTSDGQYRFSLGHWTRSIGTSVVKTTLVVTGLVSDGRVVLVDSSGLRAGMSDLEVSQALTRLEHGLAFTADLYVISPRGDTVPLGRFVADLAADLYRTETPAWPH